MNEAIIALLITLRRHLIGAIKAIDVLLRDSRKQKKSQTRGGGIIDG